MPDIKSENVQNCTNTLLTMHRILRLIFLMLELKCVLKREDIICKMPLAFCIKIAHDIFVYNQPCLTFFILFVICTGMRRKGFYYFFCHGILFCLVLCSDLSWFVFCGVLTSNPIWHQTERMSMYTCRKMSIFTKLHPEEAIDLSCETCLFICYRNVL